MWSSSLVLSLLLCCMEVGAAILFVRWSIKASSPRTRAVWLILLLVCLSTAALLAWRVGMPNSDWQKLVSPDPPAMIPWGRRTFSTGFWVASWLLPLVPLYMLKLLLDDSKLSLTEPLLRFRVALGYAVIHLLSVGLIFL